MDVKIPVKIRCNGKVMYVKCAQSRKFSSVLFSFSHEPTSERPVPDRERERRLVALCRSAKAGRDSKPQGIVLHWNTSETQKKKRKASYSLLRDRSYAGHYHNCFLKTRQTLPSTEFNIYTEAENNRQERACVTTLHQQNTDSASLIHKIIEQP